MGGAEAQGGRGREWLWAGAVGWSPDLYWPTLSEISTSQADQNKLRAEVVLQICNLNTWEAEAGG